MSFINWNVKSLTIRRNKKILARKARKKMKAHKRQRQEDTQAPTAREHVTHVGT